MRGRMWVHGCMWAWAGYMAGLVSNGWYNGPKSGSRTYCLNDSTREVNDPEKNPADWVHCHAVVNGKIRDFDGERFRKVCPA